MTKKGDENNPSSFPESEEKSLLMSCYLQGLTSEGVAEPWSLEGPLKAELPPCKPLNAMQAPKCNGLRKMYFRMNSAVVQFIASQGLHANVVCPVTSRLGT